MKSFGEMHIGDARLAIGGVRLVVGGDWKKGLMEVIDFAKLE